MVKIMKHLNKKNETEVKKHNKKSRNLELNIAPRKKQEMQRSETHVSDNLFEILVFIGLLKRRENGTSNERRAQ